MQIQLALALTSEQDARAALLAPSQFNSRLAMGKPTPKIGAGELSQYQARQGNSKKF